MRTLLLSLCVAAALLAACGTGGGTAGSVNDGGGDGTVGDASCPFAPVHCICNAATAECVNGEWVCPDPSTCQDGSQKACGTSTCTSSELCVMESQGGGALVPPDDAGNCPNDAGKCPADASNCLCTNISTTYHCAPAPPACAAGLTCSCAQPLCTTIEICAISSSGIVQCSEDAP